MSWNLHQHLGLNILGRTEFQPLYKSIINVCANPVSPFVQVWGRQDEIAVLFYQPLSLFYEMAI